MKCRWPGCTPAQDQFQWLCIRQYHEPVIIALCWVANIQVAQFANCKLHRSVMIDIHSSAEGCCCMHLICLMSKG